MAKLVWDTTGAHLYETGVDHAVLYVKEKVTESGSSVDKWIGYVWNGVTAVTEKPTGADATALYADNIKYLNLIAAEDFEATIEAYTYPDKFAECDGTKELVAGMRVGQQNRVPFCLAYRTVVGNDSDGNGYGYKLHLIYNAVASPTEKAYSTINDSPEAITFSWDLKTTPENIEGVTGAKPTASIVIDSTKYTETAAKAKLTALEDKLFGTDTAAAYMPLPGEVYTTLSGT